MSWETSSSMPPNFWEMVEEATQVTREFKAQGIIPTGDQVERETARRRRERYQVGAA